MSLPLEVQVPQYNVQQQYRFHTEFYKKPVEDGTASREAGHAVFRDEDWVVITLPGSKNTHHRRVSEALLQEWEYGKFRGGNMEKPPAPFAIHAYRMWKKGEEAPVNGTALKNWPPATPAFIKTCQAAGVYSVEDLAALNDDGLRRLGPGGLTWKRQAVEWLRGADENKSAGVIAHLEAENRGLKESNEELHRTVKAMEDRLKALEAGQTTVPSPAAPVMTDREPPTGGRKFLNEQHKELFGKYPHPAMSDDKLRAKIEEAQGQ